MKLGAILKACREKAGMSQEELAELLYISRSTISKIENNIQEVSASILRSWIMTTNTSEVLVAYLLGMDGLQIMQQILPLLSFGMQILQLIGG